MYYALLFVVVLLAVGGAYYENTVQQQKISDDEAQIATLQSKNDELTASLAQAKADLDTTKTALAEAKGTIDALSKNPAQTAPAAQGSPAASASASPAPVAASSSTTQQMSEGVVVIKGDNAEGTGFLVKTADGPAIMTNLHVLANNPHIQIQTSTGTTITPTGFMGASDRDLAKLLIADGPYTYLPLASNLSNTTHTGDEVITPGNSQGGDVVLSTKGKLLAVGPDRVEFDNPIYHGNSGGPVFHSASGTVLGVVTEAMKVDTTNDLDKTSFQSRNSAITSSMRYFGLRIDTVPKWETYDFARYQDETTFLDKFHEQSVALDSYLNSGSDSAPTNASDTKPYLSDEKIMTAHRNFRASLGAGDTASQIDALRQLSFDLDTIADRDVDKIQNLGNFYLFNQIRARDEIDYRNALKKEIADFASDVTRIGHLPRSNN